MIAAIAVAIAATVVVLGIAAVRQNSPEQQPVAISTVPAPQADSPDCQRLLEALPDQLGDYRRAPTVEPTPVGTAAWQAAADTEAIILRCGLERPFDFIVGTPLQVVDEVEWFQVREVTPGSAEPADEDARSTWFAVDRPVYVALTLPQGSGPTPIQLIADTIATTLPAQPADPGPLR